MDVDPRIGSWVRRERRNGNPTTQGHLVESIRAERVVLRCGKEMPEEGVLGRLVVHDGPVSRASRPLDWALCRGGCQNFGAG
jgi:hypothetical protein